MVSALDLFEQAQGHGRYRAVRRRRNDNRPQLRGRKADEAALTYLRGALDDGFWHELEGLWILAWAQGIPRSAYDRALSTFTLESECRGFREEWFVRERTVA